MILAGENHGDLRLGKHILNKTLETQTMKENSNQLDLTKIQNFHFNIHY